MQGRSIACALLVLVAGCLGARGPDGDPGEPQRPSYAFAEPSLPVPAPDGYGIAPHLFVAPDGDWHLVSPLGSQARAAGVWKADEGGVSWSYQGAVGSPFGGDAADIDADASGRLYVPGALSGAGLPAAQQAVAVSADHGATWDVHPVAGTLPGVERPWTVGAHAGEAFLVYNQPQRGLVLAQTEDAGATWSAPRAIPGTWDPLTGPTGVPGDPRVDANGTLYIPYGPRGQDGPLRQRLYISTDRGVSFEGWILHEAPAGQRAPMAFPAFALDDDAGLYYAWAETGVQGEAGSRVLLRFSHDGGRTWPSAVAVSPPGLTAVSPTLVAGSPGRVALTFLATAGREPPEAVPADQEWYLLAAFSQNALDANATFALVPVLAQPVHRGPLCVEAASCPGGISSRVSAAMDNAGMLVVAWLEETGSGTRIAVAAQSGGPALRGGA